MCPMPCQTSPAGRSLLATAQRPLPRIASFHCCDKKNISTPVTLGIAIRPRRIMAYWTSEAPVKSCKGVLQVMNLRYPEILARELLSSKARHAITKTLHTADHSSLQ